MSVSHRLPDVAGLATTELPVDDVMGQESLGWVTLREFDDCLFHSSIKKIVNNT